MKRVILSLLAWGAMAAMTNGAPTGSWRYDFGKAEHAVPDGFVAVDHQQLYTPETGYGWEKSWGFAHAGDGEDPLLADGIGGRDIAAEREAFFLVDLPAGVYRMTAWLGVQSPREGRFGQCVGVNGKVLLAPPGVGGWGKTFERRMPLVVEDGRARVRFFVVGESTSHRLSLLGLAIEPAPTAEADGVRLAWDAAPLEDEILGQTLTIGDRTFTEVGRRRELPLGPLPAPWDQAPLLTFSRPSPGDILPYSIPRINELTEAVATFAAPGQTQAMALGVHARTAVEDVRCGISDLVSGEHRLRAEAIELFTVTSHVQSISERPGSVAQLMPELLEKNWPFSLAAAQTQPLYMRVKVPDEQPAGIYRGHLTLDAAGHPATKVELIVRVIPITLATPPDKTWHLYADTDRWFTMSRREMEREIDDMLAHGITSINGGYPPLSGAFIEKDGRIEDTYLGRLEDGLIYAASRGLKGPILLGGTSGLIWRFRGWSINHRGEGSHEYDEGWKGQALAVNHPATKDATGLSQVCGTLLSPGESVRFSFRFKAEGAIVGRLGVRFMKTYKRDPVQEGQLHLQVRAGQDGWQHVWGTTDVPIDAPYAQVVGDFSGKGRLWIDEVELMPATRAHINYVINPGFEREFGNLDLNQPWPDSFMSDYQDALRALAKVGERTGLPIYIVGTDEAGNDPRHAFREIMELRGAHEAGLKTWCNLAPYLVEKLDGILDATCFYGDMLGSEEDCQRLVAREHAAQREIYTITSGTYEGQDAGMMPNRYGVGFFFWRSGVDGTGIWTFQRPVGDPFDDFDDQYRDHLLVYPPRNPGEAAIPTLAWEGIREGWNDFRYAYTLEMAVADARRDGRDSQAEQGEAVLNFVRTAVPWYDAYDPARFDDQAADQLRWLIAWTLLQLQEGVAADEATETDGGELRIAFADTAPAAPQAPIFCPPLATPPLIDGALDDEIWQQATMREGFELHTSAGVAAPTQTKLYLGHDRDNLYVGIRCLDPKMSDLKVTATEHDGNVFADDSIELFIDTNHDAFSYLQLCFNAAGTRFDSRCAGGYNYGNNIFQVAYGRKKVRDPEWNGDWQVRTRHFEDRWEAEVVLPFSTIGRDSDLMGILVGRNRKAGGPETSSMVSIGFFNQPDAFPTLLLGGARNGESMIEQVELPVARAGHAQVAISLHQAPAFSCQATIATPDGEATQWGPITAADGVATLPFQLPATSSTVTLEIRDGEELLHRLVQQASPPARLRIQAGKQLLTTADSEARYRLATLLTPRDREQSKLVAAIRRNGAVLASAESAIGGETSELRWTHAESPRPGFYTLELLLEGSPAGEPEKLNYPLAIVPHFLETVPAP